MSDDEGPNGPRPEDDEPLDGPPDDDDAESVVSEMDPEDPILAPVQQRCVAGAAIGGTPRWLPRGSVDGG